MGCGASSDTSSSNAPAKNATGQQQQQQQGAGYPSMLTMCSLFGGTSSGSPSIPLGEYTGFLKKALESFSTFPMDAAAILEETEEAARDKEAGGGRESFDADSDDGDGEGEGEDGGKDEMECVIPDMTWRRSLKTLLQLSPNSSSNGGAGNGHQRHLASYFQLTCDVVPLDYLERCTASPASGNQSSKKSHSSISGNREPSPMLRFLDDSDDSCGGGFISMATRRKWLDDISMPSSEEPSSGSAGWNNGRRLSNPVDLGGKGASTSPSETLIKAVSASIDVVLSDLYFIAHKAVSRKKDLRVVLGAWRTYLSSPQAERRFKASSLSAVLPSSLQDLTGNQFNTLSPFEKHSLLIQAAVSNGLKLLLLYAGGLLEVAP